MQEEVENKTVQLAVRSSKVTLKLLLRALRAYIRHHQNKKRLKQYAKSKDATVKGKQSGRTQEIQERVLHLSNE